MATSKKQLPKNKKVKRTPRQIFHNAWTEMRKWYYARRKSEHEKLTAKLVKAKAGEGASDTKKITDEEWAVIDEAHRLGLVVDVHLMGLSPTQMYDLAKDQITKHNKKKKK